MTGRRRADARPPRRSARAPSVKTRMFESYVLILLVSLVVGIFGYFWSVRIVLSETEARYSLLLDQMQDRIEQNIRGIDQLAFVLSSTTWVTEIANLPGPRIDPERISRIQLSADATEVNNYVSINPFYDRVTLVFNDKDTVMWNGQVMDIATYFRKLYRSSVYTEEELREILSTYTMGTMLAPDVVATELTPQSVTHAKLLTYVHTVPLLVPAPAATLLVSVKADTIEKLLTPIAGIESAKLYVVDGNDQIVVSNSEDAQLDAALSNLLAKHTGKPGESVETPDGQSLLLFRSKPSAEGGPWSYVALIPQSAVREESNGILYFTLALLAATLLFGLLIAYGMLRRNYKPLSDILDQVRTVGGDATILPAADEYGQIGTAIDLLSRNRRDLEEKMGRFVPLAIHGFFLKLLFGTIPTDESDVVENALGIGMDSGPWTAAVLSFEDPKDQNPDMHRIISQWETEEKLPVYSVETSPGLLAVLMMAEEREAVLRILDRMREMTRYGSARAVLAGVGAPRPALREIGASYLEAVMAANYARLEAGRDAPVFYSEINQDGRLVYNFPNNLEDELQNRARMGDSERVARILDELAAMNQAAIGTSLFAAYCFFYNLLSIALRLISEADIPLLGFANERRFLFLETVPEMRNTIDDLYARICAAMTSQREGHRTRVRKDILDYMEKALTDENLSLAALADRFDVSVPYLSKFIKDQTGENFVDYIARRRVALAKDLLRTTGLPIEEIGRRVGYSNPLTFRRAFRKVEGVTPGDFRDAPRPDPNP